MVAQFKPRERKHRKRARIEQRRQSDSIVAEDGPAESNSHAQLHEDLRKTLSQPGMSGKKKKRLDKYIENKLRKEENLKLLKKLAQRKVDTSLFQSSKDLGKQTISKRDALDRALRLERAGIETEEDRDLLYKQPSDPISVEKPIPMIGEFMAPAPEEKTPLSTHSAVGLSFGGGLKRPLDADEHGVPIIKKRQRLNKVTVQPLPIDQLSWDGFGSESWSDDDDPMSEEATSDLESTEDSASVESSGDIDDSDDDLSYPIFAAPAVSDQTKVRIKPRAHSDFKTWATEQMNKARDFTPTTASIAQVETQSNRSKLEKLRPREEDPLPTELQVPLQIRPRQVYSVQVNRSDTVQESRMKLPIVAEEQKIMEAIHNNSVVIVCGATGSGKTTQVPQFLYEAGYGDSKGPTPGLIGVTQPRRVAAVTMAKRVGEELESRSKSAYQIRFDSNVEPQTAIKFMTDGILIREISQDFALSKYSAIVIDEAHERSVNTDILIGMISRIVDLRDKLSQTNPDVKPLKMIIMSATLMTGSFLDNPKLFPQGTPPLVQSEGRQYPVTMHFSRRTRQDYVQEAFQKIVKGHRKLPPGGMLVFLTGQNEINDLAKKLRGALAQVSAFGTGARVRINAGEAPLESDDLDLVETLAQGQDVSDESSGDEDEDKEFDVNEESVPSLKALILPLYSQLPTKEQLRVFETVPENTRLIVLATNVAETSITIPGIRYVFDSGRSKERKYNNVTGIQTFEIGWISKASAIQRAGRAGRTEPGHCYRLYSSAMYERDFAEHTEPEILHTPIESVVLQLKSMDLHNTINFPFPTAPERDNLERAEKLLSYLGALDRNGSVTALGRDLSMYPVSPRFAKILAIGHQHDSIYHVTAMVAALAVPELFIPQARLNQIGQEESLQEEDLAGETQTKAYNKAQGILSAHDSASDGLKLVTALCAYMWAKDHDVFCAQMFLYSKAMKEAQRLYTQLLNIISLNLPGSVDPHKIKLQPPTKLQIATLKQTLAAGFLDQVAIRSDLAPTPPSMPRKPSRPTDVPYLTLFPTHAGRVEDVLEQVVFIHPSSILAHTKSAKTMPQYLIYSHIQRGTTATIAGSKLPKIWMHPLTAVTGVQLAALARNTPLLEYGKPIGKIESMNERGDERVVWCVPSLVGERGGGRIWPLPTVKTMQRKDGKGIWNVEKILS